MALDAKEIGVYVRQGVIFSVKFCYRFACGHPFVVGMVFCSFLLYRFLPSVFAFLVSSSPVIFCTAVLLGTLLSLGNPNTPEVDEEEKKTDEISSLKAGGVTGDLILEKDGSFTIESHVERRSEIGENRIEETGFSGGEDVGVNIAEKDTISSIARDVGENEGLVGQRIVVEDNEKETHSLEDALEERVYHNQEFVDKGEFHDILIERVLEVGDSVEGRRIDDQKNEIEDHIGGILDSQIKSHVDSYLDQDESDSDSDSDRAESSSPDASMADIMPMLDELHPLLDSEAPQPTHIPIDDSDAVSQESSHESDDGSAESAEDAENLEEPHEDQEDKTEAVVTWTEDDQKNLMDLGSSELERNQRLENLIAKRMARKHLRIAAEKNLIDLDGNSGVHSTLPLSSGLGDIEIQVPPISTVRRNPFDLPYDSNEVTKLPPVPGSASSVLLPRRNPFDLPPIPGSAPSVLLPRRNPFDLPYDHEDERGDLQGVSSRHQEELMSVQHGEMYSQGHESFTLEVPFSSVSKQDQNDIKFQPFFVAEPVASGAAGHVMFQRQYSELSDSKLSSVPDTDTVSSVTDQDHDEVLIQESHHDSELISSIEHSTEPVKRESKSFKAVDHVEIGRDEKDIGIGIHEVDLHASEIIEEPHLDISHEREASLLVSAIDEESISSPFAGRPDTSEMSEKLEALEENNKKLSSFSSLEVDENIFADKELGNIEQMWHYSLKGLSESMKAAYDGGVDSGQVVEPAYDLSPGGTRSNSNVSNIVEDIFNADKRVFGSTSSISSETCIEIPEMSLHSVAVERSISPGIVESMSDSTSVKKEATTSGQEVPVVTLLSLSAMQENESESRELMEQLSSVCQSGNDSVEPLVTESLIKQVSEDATSHLLGTKLMDEKENQQFKGAEIPISTFDERIHIGSPHLDVEGKMDAANVSYSDGMLLSDDSCSHASQKIQLLIEELAIPSYPGGTLEENQTKPTAEINDGDNVQNQVQEHVDVLQLKETQQSTECSTILVSEFTDNKFTTDKDISKDTILNRLQNEQLITEGDEGAVEIKEIDEGLLSELDAVGDFSVEESRSFENLLQSDEQFDEKTDVEITTASLTHMDVRENLPALQLLEVVELQSVAEQSKPLESEVSHEKLEMVDHDVETKESSSELQVNEASSVADIHLAFKQLHGGEDEKSVVLESVDDKPLLTVTESGSTKLDVEESDMDMEHTDLETQLIEVSSLEDISSGFKEGDVEKSISVESVDNELKQVESGVESIESWRDRNESETAETKSEFHVLEATSVVDIDLTSKQLHEEEADKSVVLEPFDDKPLSTIAEFGSTRRELEERDLDMGQIDSELEGLETRSIEDINSAFKQLHGDAEKSMSVESFGSELEQVESRVVTVESWLDKNDLETMESHSDVHALEENSHGSADSSFKLLHERGFEKLESLESIESEVRSSHLSADEKHPEHSQIYIHEASSMKGADLTLKQPYDVDWEKSAILEPVSENAVLVESEVGFSESTSNEKHSEPMEIHSEVLPSEARYHKGTNSAFNQIRESEHGKHPSFESAEEKWQLVESEVGTADSALDEKYSEQIDSDSELLLLEGKSREDINASFKQLGGDLDKPVSLEVAHNETVFAGSDMDSAETAPEKEVPNPIGIHSDLLIHEATSLEDSESALKLSFESVDSKRKLLDSAAAAEPVHDNKLFVAEARPLEDMGLTSDQIHEEHLEKSIVLDSFDDKSQMVEFEVGSSEAALDKKDLEPIETSSAQQAPETRSVEVIHSDLKLISEGNVEDPPKPEESEDKPADFEAIERHLEPIILMRSAEEIEAALKESAARETGTSTQEPNVLMPNKGVKETADGSSSRSDSWKRHEKAGSSKSSSSSSSSSSLSDSD